MILFKHLIVLFASIFYSLSLFYIENKLSEGANNKEGMIKQAAVAILTAACLTSISFMSAVFEIRRSVEIICYATMILIVIGLPIIKLLKNKFSHNP